MVHYYLKVLKTHLIKNKDKSHGSPAKGNINNDSSWIDYNLSLEPVKVKTVLEKLHKCLDEPKNMEHSFASVEEEEQRGLKEAPSKYTLD